MGDPRWLLWCDLETGGTDPGRHPILEIAVVVTDLHFDEPPALPSLSLIVNPGKHFTIEPEVRQMHTSNGLLRSLDHGVSVREASRAVVDFLARHGQKDDFMLAGSGVGHFDLHFIRQQMPEVADWLCYAVLDVGVIRRFVRFVGYGHLVPEVGDAGRKSHRALDDVRLHLDEARHYRQVLDETLARGPAVLGSFDDG